VATTRPETILGDTAVAVHPEDERFKVGECRVGAVTRPRSSLTFFAQQALDMLPFSCLCSSVEALNISSWFALKMEPVNRHSGPLLAECTTTSGMLGQEVSCVSSIYGRFWLSGSPGA